MRYFAEIAYRGTAYHGWQRQPNAPSVQQTIEEALELILRETIEIVGCGRTDTGVHARQYVLHFDCVEELPTNLLSRLNKVLPPDISFHRLALVDAAAHARFDAHHRAYEYHLRFRKDPFTTQTAYYFPFATQLDQEQLDAAARLLLEYSDFFPFCKTHSDVKTMRCELYRSEWESVPNGLVFHIAANRFLRGMVRLIVGMCLNVGQGKIELSEVRRALDTQTRLTKSYSVPPEGLFLTDIRYPFEW